MWLLQHMSEALRLSSLALFAVGPAVAVLALLRRGLKPSPTLCRIRGWRWYVPIVLLPIEWLLPPALIALQVGEIEVGWLPVLVAGSAHDPRGGRPRGPRPHRERPLQVRPPSRVRGVSGPVTRVRCSLSKCLP